MPMDSPEELIFFLKSFPIKEGKNSKKKDAVAVNTRRATFESYQHHCARCNQPSGETSEHLKLTIDHIVPKSLGSSNRRENLMLLCGSCNNRKGNNLLKWFQELSSEKQLLLFEKIRVALSLHILLIER